MEIHAFIKLKEFVQVDMNIILVFALKLLPPPAPMVTILLEAHALPNLLFPAQMEESGMVKTVLFQLKEPVQLIIIMMELNAL